MNKTDTYITKSKRFILIYKFEKLKNNLPGFDQNRF